MTTFMKAVLVFMWLQLLSIAHGVTFVPNVEVSTMRGILFTNYVKDIKPHPSDPSSLLIIDGNAILILNVHTRRTSTVVGLPLAYGYAEGVGDAVRFSNPHSFVIINQTQIIVSDTFNHCLREVDLSSRQSKRLAGMCQTIGYRNGAALQALFNQILGIFKYRGDLLVADRKNNAIRLLNGGMVATLVEGSPVKPPCYFAEKDGIVFVSAYTGLVTLNPDTASVQLIAGNTTRFGYTDGPFQTARFNGAFDLEFLSASVILLADQYNYRLRVIDLQAQTVSSIGSGYFTSLDGNSASSAFNYAGTIGVLNDTIYVGEYTRIRTIPLYSIVERGQTVATSPSTPPVVTTKDEDADLAVIECPGNVTLNFTVGANSVTYSWTEPVAAGNDVICDSCPPQPSRTFGIGSTKIVYTFRSAGGLTSACSFYITVYDVCPRREISVTPRPGEMTALVKVAGRTLTLPRGEHRITSELSNGTHCLTLVKVSGGFEVTCPKSIIVQLPIGSKTMKVSWPMPRVKGVNQSEVRCSSCPSKSRAFDPGVNTVEYRYVYTPINISLSCSFFVAVIGPNSGKLPCSTGIAVGLKKDEETATITKELNQNNVPIQLPVGIYKLETTTPSGDNCITAVQVYGTKPTARTVILQVSYQTQCDLLTKISYSIISTDLNQLFSDLASSCPECQLVGDQLYETSCESGLLNVRWKTVLAVDAESGEIPSDIQSAVLNKLQTIQNSNLETNGHYFQITILTRSPRIVSPVMNDDGLYLRLRVVAMCPLTQMVYDDADMACYFPG